MYWRFVRAQLSAMTPIDRVWRIFNSIQGKSPPGTFPLQTVSPRGPSVKEKANIMADHYGHTIGEKINLNETLLWNSPMRELIGSVMVSSPLLFTFGTLSLLLYFWLPSTFLPSKGRSITTLGTRWNYFFFITRFRYFTIVLFFKLHFFFLFSRDADSRKGTLCPFCSHSYKKKKKKKKITQRMPIIEILKYVNWKSFPPYQKTKHTALILWIPCPSSRQC